MSQSLVQQEADPNGFDGMAMFRDVLGEIAAERGDWAGLPMPLEGTDLIIEPRFPNAAAIASVTGTPRDDALEELYKGWKQINSWYNGYKRCDIVVLRQPDGTTTWGLHRAVHHLDQDLQTLMCSDAWGMKQEEAALDLLESLVQPRQFRHYMMTGMFMEASKRSGVRYIFRRIKPTVALAARPGIEDDEMRILCALCMHPIGYYANSWAGAMCPTDDVIAHLSMMRGDEKMFWKRCNQIPAYRPESGL